MGKKGEDLKPRCLETALLYTCSPLKVHFSKTIWLRTLNVMWYEVLRKKVDSCQCLRFWKGYLSQFEFKINISTCFIIHLHNFMLLFFSLIYTTVPVLVAELLWPSSEYWQGYCRGSSAPGKYCEKTSNDLIKKVINNCFKII